MKTPELLALGRRIRAHRTVARLTQHELAVKCGVLTRSSIANIERGEQDPPLTTLVAIAKALGVGVADLMPGPAEDKAALDLIGVLAAENRVLRQRITDAVHALRDPREDDHA